MSTLQFFRDLSLQHKLMSLMMLIAVLPASISGWFQYDQLASKIKDNIYKDTQLEVERSINQIQLILNPVDSDLDHLSHQKNLQTLFSENKSQQPHTHNTITQGIIQNFKFIMEKNINYMQVRAIDMHGQEIVRIDREKIASTPHIILGSNLQNKSKASYVQHALALTDGHEYISAMNLNREHGKIQQPYVPVMRFVRLIDNAQGQHIGMVVINLFSQPILDFLASEINNDDQTSDAFYLLNEDGFFLYHDKQSMRFGFELNNNNTMHHKEPRLWKSIQEKDNASILINGDFYLYNKIQVQQQNNGPNWFLVHKVKEQEAFIELNAFEKKLLLGLLAILLLIGWLSHRFSKSTVAPIQAITQQMQKLARGELDNHTIIYNGNDEIQDIIQASNNIQSIQHDVAHAANQMAQGDFRISIEAQSKNDIMGNALDKMVARLQETTELTIALSKGDLSKKFTIIDSNDQLGHAIQQLINNFQQITAHAVEISNGDFRRDFQPRSEHDELGLALQTMIIRLREVAEAAAKIATGKYEQEVACSGEYDQLGRSLQHMMQSLKDAAQTSKDQNWLESGLTTMATETQARKTQEDLAQAVLHNIIPMLHALHGSIYIWNNESSCLQLKGQYACKQETLKTFIKAGEGLTGQCAVNKQIQFIEDIPEDYMSVQSSMGCSAPTMLVEVPLMAENELTGVMELAGMSPLSAIQQAMLERLSPLLGMAIHVLQQNRNTEKLLEESQALSEELQAQEEELREANKTLVMRAEELTSSEEELQAQQEELRQNNDELIAKNNMVEAQKNDLSASAKSLTEQAKQLQQASQYKSDFLSNMSHELRTPLNSLLILSDMLAKNKEENLTEKQVKFAKTIHGSGVDLLELINNILDLAKVEAGKMTLDPHRFPVSDIADSMQRDFAHVASKKNLILNITQDDHIPQFMFSDQMRIKQVLKNLLSNAFKFTEQGDVTLHIEPIDEDQLSFSVSDSGVGIAKDKLNDIFEAFQQEDGSTSRKYGGTGLGLSICREFANLLGGHISLQSEQGKGSTFALIIPHSVDQAAERASEENTDIQIQGKDTPQAIAKVVDVSNTQKITTTIPDKTSELLPNPLDDDREQIKPGDRSILIVEDDENFAAIQQSLVQEHGFKAINVMRGDHALIMAQQCTPDAILLDLQLPVLDGMSVLDRLKQHPKLRHIPVHVISCMDKQMEDHVLKAGAMSFVRKPAKKDQLDHVLDEIQDFLQRDIKRLLIVEDDENQLEALSSLLDANDVDIITTSSGKETLDLLKKEHVDCMILDLTLPDMSGEEVLEAIKLEDGAINNGHALPVIVHTGKDLSEMEVEKLQSISNSIIIKGNVSSDRLLAETNLFLHQMKSNIPNDKQRHIENTREQEVDLNGKTILLVDDDIRNIYSLSSYLEGHDITVHTARNGLESLTALKEHGNDIDLILMDIMMPEMDGYEAMHEIRKMNNHKNLPIIALTAKAMKGDREQCIKAGASDYITKPVDTDKLISLMRVWLHE